MDCPDEGPPAKTCCLSSLKPSQDKVPLPPPLPPQLMQLPLPPLEQLLRLMKETEAAEVLADMRRLRLSPTLLPLPP
ncbi:unnamed protein product [Pipistrellus nathusii]|uniref:Uncharacterized protein n=1 Tax=Pipistrellus nathusii TaxID=59473 RepID=A0ABN9ZY45_PIPNA